MHIWRYRRCVHHICRYSNCRTINIGIILTATRWTRSPASVHLYVHDKCIHIYFYLACISLGILPMTHIIGSDMLSWHSVDVTSPFFPSWKGPIDNKKKVLEQYRFAICYENVQDSPGYITEKIFDCFFAGCIPLYRGASNISDYIPSSCYIDRRKLKIKTIYEQII